MDNGELDDLSNLEMFTCSDNWDLPINCSMDSFFDDIMKDDTRECAHTHTCNPPGPDLPHTHTCFHLHTKTLPGPSDEKIASDHDTSESVEKKSVKKPSSNRKAVRKYREKKKAHAASLQDEVESLRALNQQLMKRLQRQSALEAEVVRLRCLLVDIRGRIDGEIGSFPYHQNVASKNIHGSYMMNPCEGKKTGLNGEFGNLQCSQKQNDVSKELYNKISVASGDAHAAKAS